MFTKSSRGGVATGRSVWGCLCTIKVEHHRDEIMAHVPGATGSVWRRHVISEVDFARFRSGLHVGRSVLWKAGMALNREYVLLLTRAVAKAAALILFTI
jgi:hypothetical protein